MTLIEATLLFLLLQEFLISHLIRHLKWYSTTVFLYETYDKYVRKIAETFGPDECFKRKRLNKSIFLSVNISTIVFGKKQTNKHISHKLMAGQLILVHSAFTPGMPKIVLSEIKRRKDWWSLCAKLGISIFSRLLDTCVMLSSAILKSAVRQFPHHLWNNTDGGKRFCIVFPINDPPPPLFLSFIADPH